MTNQYGFVTIKSKLSCQKNNVVTTKSNYWAFVFEITTIRSGTDRNDDTILCDGLTKTLIHRFAIDANMSVIEYVRESSNIMSRLNNVIQYTEYESFYVNITSVSLLLMRVNGN